MRIVPAALEHLDAWAAMRAELWPWDDAETHAEDARDDRLDGGPGTTAFIALDGEAEVGFAEATLRMDYVEGCETSPVAYLEGLYVVPAARRRGAARALVDAIAAWGCAAGCTEFGSDALLDNLQCHAFHRAIGFEEAERVVHFRKAL